MSERVSASVSPPWLDHLIISCTELRGPIHLCVHVQNAVCVSVCVQYVCVCSMCVCASAKRVCVFPVDSYLACRRQSRKCFSTGPLRCDCVYECVFECVCECVSVFQRQQQPPAQCQLDAP